MLILKGWTEIKATEKENESLAREIRGTLEITDLGVQAGESFKDERTVNIKSVSERDQER